jgi:geranylgeranyl diphosphate synthase type II
MRSIEEYHKIILNEVEIFQSSTNEMELYAPVKYILDLGGKRMRPILT